MLYGILSGHPTRMGHLDGSRRTMRRAHASATSAAVPERTLCGIASSRPTSKPGWNSPAAGTVKHRRPIERTFRRYLECGIACSRHFARAYRRVPARFPDRVLLQSVAVCAPRATRGAWLKQRRTWSIIFHRCRCANVGVACWATDGACKRTRPCKYGAASSCPWWNAACASIAQLATSPPDWGGRLHHRFRLQPERACALPLLRHRRRLQSAPALQSMPRTRHRASAFMQPSDSTRRRSPTLSTRADPCPPPSSGAA